MDMRASASPAIILVLAAGLLGAVPARANPSLVDEGGGIRRATWDFEFPADYTVENVTTAPGAATLASETTLLTYATDAEFGNVLGQATNVVVQQGLRLADNATGFLSDGTFDGVPGPWTYTNGTTNAVTAERDPDGRARLGYQGAVLQFDSMDDIAGTNPWVSAVSGGGDATSNVSQERLIRAEGNGSLRDDVTILQSGGNRWGGAIRDDALPWNWTGYDRLALRMNKATPGFLWGWVYVQDELGMTSFSFFTPITGWFRYAVDLNSSMNFGAVDFIQLGFAGAVGATETIYIDDIVLMNSTGFAETAKVEQTFTKSFATGPEPNAFGLRFDVAATPSANVDSSLEVRVNNTVEWSESPVSAGTSALFVDLSGDPALRGTGSFTLAFALRLNRTGWEEARMTAWIDNVTLVGSFEDGSFVSVPLDMGSAAIWQTVSIAATTPSGTSVSAETHTGNSTDSLDGSWTPWVPVLGTAIQSPPSRFLEWRLQLETNGSETPIVTELAVRAERYAPTGQIRSNPFFPSGTLVAWREFLANESASGPTSVAYELSFDGGATWTPAVSGQDLSALPRSGVVVRAILRTANTSFAPTVVSWSLRYEVASLSDAPLINGVVPDQFAQEDGPAWSLDLVRFAENQTDPSDTMANLKWSLTGVNTNLYTVFGEDTFGRHNLVLTPMKDAFGTDEAILWLEDREGQNTSQPLRVTISPVDDPPAWRFLPEVWVRFRESYTLFLIPYVADIDTAPEDLAFTTEDPAHITVDGPNVTYTYPAPPRTLWVRHYVSDGVAPPVLALVTIHVTDNPPPQVRKPIPDLAVTEDVKAVDVFRPDSLTDFFVDIQGEAIFLTSNFTNLVVEIWDGGPYVQVNVSGKPDFCGIDRITFRATDERRAFSEDTVIVTVLCVNDPPTLSWRDDVYVRFDTAYLLDLSPFVADVDNTPDELILSTSDPVHARVAQLVVTFQYSSSEFGPSPTTVPVSLNLTDGGALVTVQINAIVSNNRPPELVRPFEDLQFLEDMVQPNVLNLPLYFVDDTDAQLGFLATAAVINVTLSSGLVTLRPPPDWFGHDALVIRATDSQGAFAVASLRIDVLPVNDAPVLVTIPLQARDHGGQWVLDLRPFVHDVDNDPSELRFSTNSANVAAAGYLLVFAYPDRSATEPFTLTVKDPDNGTATTLVTVRIGPSIWATIYWPWSGAAVAAAAAISIAGWRARARRRYAIEDLIIMGHEGLLIAHTTRRLHPERDPDILAGMLTATLMFIRDAFREDKNELSRFELTKGRAGIVQKSAHVYGVAIAAGRAPDTASLGLKDFLSDIEERYGDRLAAQVGAIDERLPGLTWAMSIFARRGRYRSGDLERLIGTRHDGHTPRRRWRKPPPASLTPEHLARNAAGLPEREDSS